MNFSFRTRAARAAFALAAVATLTLPLDARGTALAHSQRYGTDVPDADDEGLLFSGNPVVLINRSDRAADRAWMEFKTDPCGTLLRVENRRSRVMQSGFSNDLDDDDDDDPADLGREMVGRWLSEHPELAVINDGVDKGCDGGWYDDEERPGDFQAQRIIIENQGSWPGRIDASLIA
ncbi:MAG TPA: hypothetical protein VK192_11145 [Sphingomicrobium sp.]|nr:hypothetical protein [Sphingomicrobium sp.]